MPVSELRQDAMMRHLVDTLESGSTVGHYGRLVFAMVGRHFVDEEELTALLAKDPECSEEEARTLLAQVKARNYNPPHRDRILEWMSKQEFAICPEAENPRACNVYRDLQFPESVYHSISAFYEQHSQG